MVVISYGLIRGFRLHHGDVQRIAIASLSVLISIAVMVIFITLSNLGIAEILVLLVILAVVGAAATEIAGQERLPRLTKGNMTQSRPVVLTAGKTGWSRPVRPSQFKRRPKVRGPGMFGKLTSALVGTLKGRRKQRAEKLISDSFGKIGAGELDEAVKTLQSLRDSETDPAVLMRTYINLAWLQKNLGNRAGAIIELQHALEYSRFLGDERMGREILKMIRDLAYR